MVILTIFPTCTVNHKLPSGPAVISTGPPPLGTEYSVIIPVVVILPILSVPYSANHRLPSGPVVIPFMLVPLVGSGYAVTAPAVVILPILSSKYSANQRLPSGPLVMATAPP